MIRFLGKDLLPLLLKEVPHTSCKETLKGKKGRKNSNDIQNITRLLGNREFLFECSLSQVSEANKLDEFHISKQPCIIIFVYSFYTHHLAFVFTWASAELFCTHTSAVTCEHYFLPSGILWGTCTTASSRGLHSLALSCVCSCTCPSASVELALVSLCSLLLSTCAWIPRHCYSTIPDSGIVFGLFLPYPPFFPLFILSQCNRCPSSLLPGGLMAELKGFASHGSGLI